MAARRGLCISMAQMWQARASEGLRAGEMAFPGNPVPWTDWQEPMRTLWRQQGETPTTPPCVATQATPVATSVTAWHSLQGLTGWPRTPNLTVRQASVPGRRARGVRGRQPARRAATLKGGEDEESEPQEHQPRRPPRRDDSDEDRSSAEPESGRPPAAAPAQGAAAAAPAQGTGRRRRRVMRTREERQDAARSARSDERAAAAADAVGRGGNTARDAEGEQRGSAAPVVRRAAATKRGGVRRGDAPKKARAAGARPAATAATRRVEVEGRVRQARAVELARNLDTLRATDRPPPAPD